MSWKPRGIHYIGQEAADYIPKDTEVSEPWIKPRKFGWLEYGLVAAVLALVGQIGWPFLRAWLHRPLPGKQVEVEAQPYDYLAYLPLDFRHGNGRSWPLLLNLHGSGERGDDLQLLYRTGLPTAIAEGMHLPFIVVSPQCPEGRGWNSAQLLKLLDELEERYPVSCVVATGYSMGGFGSWRLAETAPHRLAAIAPICGGGEPSNAEKLVNLPVWAFHGARDKAVSREHSQRMVDAVNAAGGDAKLTLYADKGHGIWDSIFRDQRLYDWLQQNCERKAYAAAHAP